MPRLSVRLSAPPVRLMPRTEARAVIAATYLGGFGAGVFAAVMYLVNKGFSPSVRVGSWTSSLTSAFTDLGVATLMAVCAYLLLGHLGVPRGYFTPHHPTATRWWRRWQREIVIGSFVMLAGLISFALMALVTLLPGIQTPDFPHRSGAGWNPSNVEDLLTSMSAGVVEELLFCLIIPLCLIAAGRSILVAASISAALRVLFHIYYGWTSPLLAIWAFIAVIVVLRTGAIIGVIILHSLFDTIQSLTHMFPAVLDDAGPIALALLIVGIPFATARTFARAFDALKDDGLPARTRARRASRTWVRAWLSPAATSPDQPASNADSR